MKHSVSSALRGLVFLAAGAFLAPGSLFAVQHEVRILMDLDNDVATGCTVPTVGGPFDGVEQILITTVDTTSPPPAGTVTDVATSDCINPATDTFGPPASFDGGWPIGVDNGEGGLDVVETYFPLLSSVVPDPKVIRVAVVVSDELGGEQALLTKDGTPDGPAILVDLRSLLEIPTLGEWGLILLALLLAGSSIVLLGRRGAVAAAAALLLLGGGLAWAAPGLDGLIGDWFPQDRVAGNGIVLWAKKVGNDLCFRIDLELLFNTSPTADPQSVTTDEDTSVAITLTGSDPESDPLTFTIVPGSGPDHGTLTGTPPNLSYDPDPDYNGPDSFDFQVEDPSAATGIATVSITVDPVNDPPVARDDAFATAEDTQLTGGNVLADNGAGADSDVDGDPLTVNTTPVSGPANGTLALNADGTFTYDPNLDFNGADTFEYELQDGNGGTDVGLVTITVTSTNDAPVAQDDAFTTAEDVQLAGGNVLADNGSGVDSDADSDPLTVNTTPVSGPANGTLALNADGTFTYDPDADFNGADPFEYEISDGNGGSDVGQVTITVTTVNDDPTAVDDNFLVVEDSLNNPLDVLANDDDAPDTGETLTVTGVGAPDQGGSVAVNGTNDGLVYTPAPNFTGNETFTYDIADGNGGAATATVTVAVSAVNDAPVVDLDGDAVGNDFAVAYTENDGAVAAVDPVDATITDVDSLNLDSVTVTLENLLDGGQEVLAATSGDPDVTVEPYDTTTVAGQGILRLTTVTPQPIADFVTVLRTVTYEHSGDAPDASEPRTITFVADDGTDTGPAATSTVTITSVNDAPVAQDDAFTTNEDVELSGGNVLDDNGSGADDDDDGDTLTVNTTPVSGPSDGTLNLNAGGTFTYDPDPNFNGIDSFTYEVTDGNGGSDTATVTVTVNAVNDAPTITEIADQTIDEDTSTGALGFTIGDAETAAASLTLSGASSDTSIVPLAGIVFGGSGAGRTVMVTPASNANGGPVTITVTVSDGTTSTDETFTVTVTAVNDLPTITAIADQTIDEDSSTGALAFTIGDVETAPASLTLSGASSDTSIVPTANIVFAGSGASRTVTVTPAANANGGPVTITVTVSDGTDTSDEVFTVTVNPVNDLPTITAIADQTIDEDTSTGSLAFTVDDVETAAGSLVLSGASSDTSIVPLSGIAFGGSGASRTVTVTPAANAFGGPVTITVTVSDGADSADETFAVTVNSVNDAPTITAIADQTIDEDTSTGALAFTVDDVETAAGSLTLSGSSSNTTIIPDANIVFGGSGASRTVTITPAEDLSGGPVTITVTVSDGTISTDEVFTVTVNSVNDLPTITAIADQTIDEDTSTGALAFTVDDVETAAGSLVLSGGSSDTSIVPLSGIVFGGSGASRTVTVTPAANAFGGPVTITVTVSDGTDSADETFTVTVNSVNDAPTITAIADQTIDEDTSTGALAFTIDDVETAAGSLILTPASSDTAIVPVPGIVIGGSGASRTVTVTPAANAFGGPVTITISVSDGDLSADETFLVTVNPVNDPPVAGADAFDFIGNTELRVDTGTTATPHALETTGSGFGALDNDADPVENDDFAVTSITVGACTDSSGPTFDCTDAAVGTVHMQPDGSFSFEPAAGDAGATESFTYVVTDDGSPAPASSVGTVTLTRFERVWYVDPNAGGGGDGTSASPFNALTAANLADTSGDLDLDDDLDVAGDWIFVHDGTLALPSPWELEASQHLVGEGEGLSIPVDLNGNGSPTNLVPAGTHPVLTNGSGDAVIATEAVPIEIVGLSLQGSSNAIDVTTDAALTGSGTLTIDNNIIRGASTEGIDVTLALLTTGTLNLNVTGNTWNVGTHTGNAIDINRAAGTLRLDVSNNTNIRSGGTAVNIADTALGNTTITGFANNTVHQSTGGSGIIVTNATFDGTPGAPYNQVSGGTTVVGISGNGVGVSGVVFTNVAGDLAFTDLDVFADNGTGLGVTGTGAVNVAAGTGTRVTVGAGVGIIEATGGPAVNLSNLTTDLQLNSLTSTNSGSQGVSLTSVTGTFSAPSGSAITNATGTDFVIASSSAAVTYNGTITDDVGQLVSVSSSGGSLKSFTGAITDGDDGDGGGISLSGNSSTIRFSGGVVLSTGGNAAFAATGGGTVEVCDENPCNPGATGLNVNKITTTTGTALNVANTTIGANNLELRSISAGTGASGPTNGIVLNNTGSSGGLKVKGTGSAGSGGTIQDTSGHGISLTTTLGPSFDRMIIDDTGGSGIMGTDVTNVTITNCTISDSGTALGTNDSNIAFNIQSAATENNLDGVVTITNNSLTNAYYHGVDIFNFNGTISDATISNNTITSTNSTVTSKGSGIRLVAFGSASTVGHVTKATLDNNVISNFPSGAGIVAQGGNAGSGGSGTFGVPGSGTNVIAITNNRIAGFSSGVRMSINAIQAVVNGSGQGNFNISNNGTVANPITNVTGNKIVVSAIGEVTVKAEVDNNRITANDTAGVGGAFGISAGADSVLPGCIAPAGGNCDSPNFTLSADGNVISGTDGSGIFIRSVNNLGSTQLFLSNNNVGAPLAGFRESIQVHAGSSSDSSDTSVCLKATGNTSAGSGGADGIGLRKNGTSSTVHAFAVDGMVATSSPGVETYVHGLNSSADGALDGDALGVTLISATSGFTNCTFVP